MRALFIQLGITFVVYLGLGIFMDLSSNQPFFLYMMLFLFVIVAIIQFRRVWVLNYSTDMERLHRIVERNKRRPLYAVIRALGEEDYATAEKMTMRLKSRALRARMLYGIAIEQDRVDEANELLQSVKDAETRLYFEAMMAIRKRDWTNFEEKKQVLTKPSYRKMVDIEAAFARGDMETAKKLGQSLIDETRGLQRYILVDGLERQERKGAERTTYF